VAIHCRPVRPLLSSGRWGQAHPELRAVREVRSEGDLSSVPEQPSSVSMAVTMAAVRTTWASPSEVMVWQYVGTSSARSALPPARPA
jgi:hypothetical protein